MWPSVVAVPEQRLTDALKALDPVSRALLDLSVRRGIPDDEIASIVGTDRDRVADRRDEILRQMAGSVGLAGGPDDVVVVRNALKQIDWRSRPRGNGVPGGPPGEAERQGERAPTNPPHDVRVHGPEPRSLWVLIAAALLSLLALRKRGSA